MRLKWGRARVDTTVVDAQQSVRGRFAELAGPDPAENRELFTVLVSSFVGRAAMAAAELRELARRGDAAGFAKAAHALRGDAANLGGSGVARLLADLEQRGRSGTLGQVEADLGRLGVELDALCGALVAAGAESWTGV